MTANYLSIRDIAEQTNLTEHTLRYYERIGLMVPVHRNESGHRAYDENAVEWVVLLGHLRATGMGIQEMLRFSELVRIGESSVPERLHLLEDHRDKLNDQIQALYDARSMVQHKIDVYRAGLAETPRNPEDHS